VLFSSRHPENIKPLAARSALSNQVAQGAGGRLRRRGGDGRAYAAIAEIGKAARTWPREPKQMVMDICDPIARRDGDDVVRWAPTAGGAGLASAKMIAGGAESCAP